jgi:hypothetical protein
LVVECAILLLVDGLASVGELLQAAKLRLQLRVLQDGDEFVLIAFFGLKLWVGDGAVIFGLEDEHGDAGDEEGSHEEGSGCECGDDEPVALLLYPLEPLIEQFLHRQVHTYYCIMMSILKIVAIHLINEGGRIYNKTFISKGNFTS